MIEDETAYFTIDPPDESDMVGSIQTFGAATTVIDQYRTAGIYYTNLPDIGAAFTDVAAVAAISKIAEGGLNHFHELERAEAACQALLLHEVVHVIMHAPKINYGNGFASYARSDENSRTDFGYKLFAIAHSRDFLVAPELAHVEGDKISKSTFSGSPLVGQTLESLHGEFDYWSSDVGAALNATISQHGIPGYITDSRLQRTRRGDGFHKRFYNSLRVSWDDATNGTPPIVCSFLLPPLLAVVLNRMNKRHRLLETISELREELMPVRKELVELNNLVTSSTDEGDIQRRLRHLTDSFEAIIPEARLSDAQRLQRRLAIIQKLVRPLIRFMAGFVTKTGVSPGELIQRSGEISDVVIESRAIIDRTVTAQTFAGLMKIEAVQSLVKHHFSSTEIDAIEATMP